MFVISRRKIVLILIFVISSLGLFSLTSYREEESIVRQPRQTRTFVEQRSSRTSIVNFDSATRDKKFNISGDDLFVLLHIQKTGGTTFERHLVQDMILDHPCSCNSRKRRCSCPRRVTGEKKPLSLSDLTWLISRFSTGWVCGLHPDLSQLEKCLAEAENLYFMTFLRHPLHRFISEYRHIQRGATWKAVQSHCAQYDTRLCYGNRPDWSNATLDEFLNCPSNMAINRQTRMLASYDLSKPCDESKIAEDRLLRSAKENLKKLAYFGICEKQRSSQVLFERTFDLKFRQNFTQSEDNKTQIFIQELSKPMVNRMLRVNHLDLQLYRYAIDVFASRCTKLTNSSFCGIVE